MSGDGQGGLKQRIEAFLAADPAREISEDGALLFARGEARCRLEESRGKLLLHLWSSERNWVRRVLGVAEETGDRLVLEVERFGQRRPGKLVLARAARGRGRDRERVAARRKYGAWLRRLLEREFPRARVEALSTAADPKRSFSGLYTRARLREAERWWAVLGVSAGEDAPAVDALLTYAFVWFDWNRRRYPERVWAGLRLFLPAGRTRTTANRLASLDASRLRAELYAVDEGEASCLRLDARDFGNLETHLAPARRAQRVLAAESSAVERIRTLAPQAIEAVVPPGDNQLMLRFHGLAFARSARGQVSFGLGRQEQPLTAESLPALEALVERLRRERAADGPASSPCYRSQPERWLESLVWASPQKIDPRLERARLYRQVPAVTAGERGVADLLGATREGQLVVIELKAAADINLPLQALDYWLRVRWHQERGELSRAGYFSGVNLKPDPPELLLVAPALQFHSTTETLVSYLAPAVRVTLVGLNEDWRRALKVMFRRGRRALAAPE
ncbi:MAG: hypothetical protein ACE5IP_03915 [Terriglobia bacterium]